MNNIVICLVFLTKASQLYIWADSVYQGMQETKLDRSKLVAYLQDNEFMGFVEAYAEEIKGSAKMQATRLRIMVRISTSYLLP